MKHFRIFLIFLLGLSNAACTLNSTRPLPTGGVPAANRAVVVYGIQVKGSWPGAGFWVEVAEYDIEKQNITGNCFRFNRTKGLIPPDPGAIKYFAFDVPPGHYVYSPFHFARSDADVFAFEAPAGKSVYLGAFILEDSNLVSLTRNLNAVRNEINEALPGLEAEISVAKARLVKRPFPFLCAP